MNPIEPHTLTPYAASLERVPYTGIRELGEAAMAMDGVLRLYFGFDGTDPLTLEDIGTLLGVTRERVRQIKEKALSRLRRSDQAAALATLCPR